MKIKIKRHDKTLPLPEYKTPGAAAFDLSARETMTIKPGKIAYIPLNVSVATPKDHVLLLAARSSTHKRGLSLISGIGLIDPDFRGNSDEPLACLLNFTNKSVTVERGDRIAQGTFIEFTRAEWKEVDQMEEPDRGGFGTTGKK